jgi:isoamylase
MRNLVSTLLLSQGVPMLLAGDEFGRTQAGNNNAYCLDNETNWIDWEGIDAEGRDFLAYVRALIQFRRAHIVMHRHRFFRGARVGNEELKDVTWLNPDGSERTEANWNRHDDRSLSFVLSGEAHGYHLTRLGEPEPDDTFFIILNAQPESIACRAPGEEFGQSWRLCFDTVQRFPEQAPRVAAGELVPVEGRSFSVFVREDGVEPDGAAETTIAGD